MIWPIRLARPSVPFQRCSRMSKRGFSTTTRWTPRVAGALELASSAACSSWVAAFCTVPSVDSCASRRRIESRSFCAASGSEMMSWLASSLKA